MIDNKSRNELKRIIGEMGSDYVCQHPAAFAGAILDMCCAEDVKLLTTALRAHYSVKLMAFFTSGGSDPATWAQQKAFLIHESGMSAENAEEVLDALWQAMGWQRPRPSQPKPAPERIPPKVEPKPQPVQPKQAPEKKVLPKVESKPQPVQPKQKPGKAVSSANAKSTPAKTNWFGVVLAVVCLVAGINLYDWYMQEPELNTAFYHSWKDSEGRCWDVYYTFERSDIYHPRNLIHTVTLLSSNDVVEGISVSYEVPYGMDVSEAARKRLDEIYQSLDNEYYRSGGMYDGRNEDRPELGFSFFGLDDTYGRERAFQAGYLSNTGTIYRYSYGQKLESDGYKLAGPYQSTLYDQLFIDSENSDQAYIDSENSSSSGTDASSGRTETVSFSGTVNVRTGPGVDYKIIGSVRQGQTLLYGGETRYDNRSVAWYSVNYDGQIGWVSSKYASLDSA